MSITKPGKQVLKPGQNPFEIGQFINNVCNDKYVLVLGSEVILDKEKYPEENGNIQSYLLNFLNNEVDGHFTSLNDLMASRPTETVGECYSGPDLIRWALLPDKRGNAFLTRDDLSPELVELLGTRLFRFVMTTSVDRLVEEEMRDIWGDALRVVNIADQDDWKRFQQEIVETIDRSNPNETVYRYNRPTLIYIFGKASKDTYLNFLKTENDAIEFIELWMKRKEPIIKMIKERRVLALGCKFKDWYFRFFWYILRQDFTRLGEGEVAISLDERIQDEKELRDYLKRKHIQLHSDARCFMRSICDILSPGAYSPDSESFHSIIRKKRGNGEIFLSYCSRDFVLASRVFFQLTDLGYSVWFDNEKLCGGDYRSDIRRAIANAKLVITLLTPNIMEDLTAGETDHFYNEEWKMAAQTGCERILPLAADGYDLRAIYHKRYEQVIKGEPDGVDLMEEGMSQLRKTIDHLKMR